MTNFAFVKAKYDWQAPLMLTILFISIAFISGHNKLQAAEISMSYDNLPNPAIEAFEKAKNIWQRCIVSDAPINIHVTGIPKGPTGFAIPRGVRNLPHLPLQDTWYPTALANALKGQRDNDLDDMNIFMSLRSNWYYGIENNELADTRKIKPDQVDYTNVALHEIAHGLGISSVSFIPWQGNADEKVASIGFPNEYLSFFNYTFPLPELDGTPTIYDRFIISHEQKPITSYANPSNELALALSAQGIYFSGAKTKEVNGDYLAVTPGNISHIPAIEGKTTPIMLANSGVGESVHTLDPMLTAMLRDIGWEIASNCP